MVGTAIGNQPQPPAPLPAEPPPQHPKEILIAGETVRVNILGVAQNDAYLVGGDSLGRRGSAAYEIAQPPFRLVTVHSFQMEVWH